MMLTHCNSWLKFQWANVAGILLLHRMIRRSCSPVVGQMMCTSSTRRLWTVLLFCALPVLAQRGRGELRLTVTDPAGLGVEASVELVSQANQVQQVFRTDWEGHYAARGLPFGFYRLQVDRPGFTSFSELVEIRSEVPLEYQVTLGLAPMEATEVVRDSPTLLDPYGTGAVYHVGSENLSQRRTSSPG